MQQEIDSRVKIDLKENGIGVLYLAPKGAKVAVLTPERIQSLKESIDWARKQSLRGLIITGPGPEMFSVGADISLIGSVQSVAEGEKLAKMGQEVFTQIASLNFPTIAAISGPCMGGGCELALACTYRIISDDKSSFIGLPEVRLGILPGFGGCVRLPRLIGLPKALDIIAAGKKLAPAKAKAYGLVDDIVSPLRLIEHAEGILLKKIKINKATISLKDKLLTFTSFGRNFIKNYAIKSTNKETKGFYVAPIKAINIACECLNHEIPAALNIEAKALGELIVGTECKSLVYLFNLQNKAKSYGKPAMAEIDQGPVTVVGAGVMGSGIAFILAKSGIQVLIKDVSEEALKKSKEFIRIQVEKIKYLGEREKTGILQRIDFASGNHPRLAASKFVIEAIIEDLALKQKVLQGIAEVVSPETIIATNTSSLPITDIASTLPNPERFVGMHFFNPVDKMPLIEIIMGKATNNRAVILTAALTNKIGKSPVIISKDVPGFLINRILSAYLAEAARLLADGGDILEIDKAACSYGLPMGPFRLLDEVGLDVATHVNTILVAAYGDRLKAPDYAKMLFEKGRKGKKSGAGFYSYRTDSKGKEIASFDNEVYGLLGLKKPEQVKLQRTVERLAEALKSEATLCLREGVAGVADMQGEAEGQINLASVMGFGFPAWMGGVLRG